MRHVQRGFTLVELMIAVAIVGVLSTIATQSYQNYTTRTRIVELVSMAGVCKNFVTEYYQSNGTFPADLAQAGCSNINTQYIAGLDVVDGTIIVTAATGAGRIDPAAAGDFILVPDVSGVSILGWKCDTSTIPKRFLPSHCRS